MSFPHHTNRAPVPLYSCHALLPFPGTTVRMAVKGYGDVDVLRRGQPRVGSWVGVPESIPGVTFIPQLSLPLRSVPRVDSLQSF